jgi:tripartite-type tricarboxylate transporter receptor subunit TctC
MIRLRLGQVAAVAAAVVLGPVVAHSQDYPNRTKLHGELRAIGNDRDMRNEFVRLGLVPVESPPPDGLKRFVASEIARWANVVREAGLAGSE